MPSRGKVDGRILVRGAFDGASSIGGLNSNANNPVESIAVQADRKVLAGGFFSGANSIGGQLRNYRRPAPPDVAVDQSRPTSPPGWGHRP